MHEREAQKDSGKGVRVLQREDRASDPIADLKRQAQRAVYEVANYVGERSQYQSGICVLFLNFVLIEVLKQSKTLTFLFLLCFFSPQKYVFLTAKGDVGNRSLMEVTSSGQSVEF